MYYIYPNEPRYTVANPGDFFRQQLLDAQRQRAFEETQRRRAYEDALRRRALEEEIQRRAIEEELERRRAIEMEVRRRQAIEAELARQRELEKEMLLRDYERELLRRRREEDQRQAFYDALLEEQERREQERRLWRKRLQQQQHPYGPRRKVPTGSDSEEELTIKPSAPARQIPILFLNQAAHPAATMTPPEPQEPRVVPRAQSPAREAIRSLVTSPSVTPTIRAGARAQSPVNENTTQPTTPAPITSAATSTPVDDRILTFKQTRAARILQKHFRQTRPKLITLARIVEDLRTAQRDLEPTVLSTPLVVTNGKLLPQNNKAFVMLEETLTKLLVRADAVQSDGVALVRDARKKVVGAVNTVLGHLDAIRRDALRRAAEEEASRVTSEQVVNKDSMDVDQDPSTTVDSLPPSELEVVQNTDAMQVDDESTTTCATATNSAGAVAMEDEGDQVPEQPLDTINEIICQAADAELQVESDHDDGMQVESDDQGAQSDKQDALSADTGSDVQSVETPNPENSSDVQAVDSGAATETQPTPALSSPGEVEPAHQDMTSSPVTKGSEPFILVQSPAKSPSCSVVVDPFLQRDNCVAVTAEG
ncbi:uncharacterized protein SPPG_03092 [Spizellomyces punctatus DAOM BR117]|uniref:BAG domain-containing protein n=1 Tax=Spizellomyces punctatus (strain DAOM BR117) TaxID=645134 RepID=A0A0L0HJJ0_SPIPD|nr:uncharacterized protein SPPG_03092 [Spizellomyces punctatus DAOM BR117]KND01282.1 hypothetical protein SPPG_03092 [Spizellomyces punctatus DAOM BR117]|eukprot:XP_016609321.1 hypothetical protein SPPG_03092 [Spizellomyces punctatus DAOM BR117]